MNVKEFSDGFDTLVSSYMRFKNFDKKEELDSIEFDEYEKSLFLTNAQEEIVVNLYNGKNIYGEGFELTEELRRYLEPLVKSKRYTEPESGDGVTENSKFFTLPSDLAYIIMEQLKLSDESLGCMDGSVVNVLPTTHDEYMRIRNNPFRGSTERRALRLDSGNNKVEIVSKYAFSSYYIRYISKPNPIVLEDLPSGVTINGCDKESGCLLPELLHRLILQRAVQMALATKGVKTSN